ncbi:ABC transporter substrate-binding protein [Brevibacillus laterosporus]
MFRLTDYGVPSYYELVLVTSDQTAAKKRRR